MSPFRIALSFAIAGLAVWQALAHPEASTFWYILAGVSSAVGIMRVLKYLKTNSQSGTGGESPPQ